jgi:hypothetical protein
MIKIDRVLGTRGYKAYSSKCLEVEGLSEKPRASAVWTIFGPLSAQTSENWHSELEGITYVDDEESPEQRMKEADHQLAFVTSIIVESVVGPVIKPKGWLEDEMQNQEDRSPFWHPPGGRSSRYAPYKAHLRHLGLILRGAQEDGVNRSILVRDYGVATAPITSRERVTAATTGRSKKIECGSAVTYVCLRSEGLAQPRVRC